MPQLPEPPRGRELYAEFLAAWPRYTPVLGELALRVHWYARYLTEAEREAQALAIQWAWEGALPLSPRELRRLGIVSDDSLIIKGIPLGVLDVSFLESCVCAVLAGIAEEVRTKRRRLDCVHPDHHRRFEPDFSVLQKLSPHDRNRNQATRDGQTLTDLRLYDPLPAEETGPNPRQPSLSLPEPGRVSAGTAELVISSNEPSPRQTLGRPSLRQKIVAAFNDLSDAQIDAAPSLRSLYPLIRWMITGSEVSAEGLRDETIRRAVSKLYHTRKAASRVAPTQ
jgi:hypothetical protein